MNTDSRKMQGAMKSHQTAKFCAISRFFTLLRIFSHFLKIFAKIIINICHVRIALNMERLKMLILGW